MDCVDGGFFKGDADDAVDDDVSADAMLNLFNHSIVDW